MKLENLVNLVKLKLVCLTIVGRGSLGRLRFSQGCFASSRVV